MKSIDQLESELHSLMQRADSLSIPDEVEARQSAIDAIGVYMDDVDSWNSAAEELLGKTDYNWKSEDQKSQFATLVEKFAEKHAHLTTLAEKAMGDVQGDLKQLHKKGNALKKYIDRFPASISITGKRKG